MIHLRFLSIREGKKSVSLIFFMSLLALYSCKNKTNQKSYMPVQMTAHQQAMQDSLAREQAKNMANIALQKEREQMTKKEEDTTTHRPGIASVEKKKTSTSGSGNISAIDSLASSGNFALQVSSWRSQKRAKNELKKWENRGFKNAYVATCGKKSADGIWYRVRLGFSQTYAVAERTGKDLENKYDAHFWVSYMK